MRMPWQAAFGGVVLVLVGAAGLIRGEVPMPTPTSSTSSAAPIIVSGAYVRAQAPPTDAVAAYFTVYNTTSKPDRLLSVASGAGASTMLHSANMAAEMGGAVIPAHGKLVLSVGHGHVMIEKLFGTVRAGQTVNLDLTFQNAGDISVAAKVISLDAPIPTAGAS